ncbi:alpha/beta hydrolase [Croceicoccus bisphenolivorans]|uniref:alpha/beta hydrolase n=1 Tax=Croceicoccus bisphenolivorans TaxID=1783232 RepID=UPI000837001F|nr:alpha/beta hydrolase [Croceicoccus bisphenolivorans]
MSDYETHQVPGNDRRSLDIEIFRPAKPNGVGVVLLHGGGFAQGHRSMMHGYGGALAEQGFVAVAAEYRLLGEAPFPAMIDDIRDVVRWLKANARTFGIDPGKIALQGYSAGAHIALMVAGTQPGSGFEGKVGGDSTGSDVAAVVAFFPPARLDANPAMIERPPFSLLLNGGGMEAARAASPIYYVNANSPTTFILGGMADYMQPLPSGLDLLNAFVEAGAEVEFHYLHSQVHEFSSTSGMLGQIMVEVGFFYRRTLLDREVLLDEAKASNPFARASNMQELAQMMAGAPR